jgi:hypothetical protein
MPNRDLIDIERTLRRMCGEYLEMPGLRLTPRQAQRLWGLDEETCSALLKVLLEVGFLQQTRDGTYARTTDGPAAVPGLRMAKAHIAPAVRSRFIAGS